MTPEEFILKQERENLAMEELGFLCEDDRKTILWRLEVPPVHYDKIAKRLGVSTSAAWQRHQRALKRIRLNLAKKGINRNG